MKITKFLNGWYRITGTELFSNVKKEKAGWVVDIRYNSTSELRQYAGIWSTKREAVEEAIRVIEYYEGKS